ncbi:hypothetical protein HY988_02290 [Candidatus Micrarchaeota archaeon]|nr:hypothetical protein [Candidatus Micrarchaeota archaeon]
MFVVYLYDIKAKNKKTFNRTKRMFYYYLNKLNLKKEFWKSKSVLAVTPEFEKKMDLLFKRFRGSVIAYKIITDSVEKI